MKLFSAALLCLGPILSVAAVPPPAAEANLVAGNAAFAAELYAKIAPPTGNLFFSPYSISLALSLAYAGSGGETAAEMARVLHLPGDPAKAAQGFADLAGRLAALSPEDATLAVGNSLWYQQGIRLQDSYLRLARDSYHAQIQAVDFIHRPGAACDDINRWVGEATQGKILKLVAPDAVGSGTRVVLANAIYFKGRWESPFRSERTQPAPFYSAPGRSAPVPMMSQHAVYHLVQRPGFRLLEMPYRGRAVSLIVLLPDAVDGLPEIERQLGGDDLTTGLRQLAAGEQYEVALSFPRFNAETGLDLSSPLRQLGLRAAFDPQRADFSGIAAGREFSLSQILHKAVVEVNEQGTVAAAATGVMMSAQAVIVRPKADFRVDHPFLFFIRENSTGTLLFFGRITQPRT